MHTKTDYQCLVFDWDGTLIDSIERIVTSLQTAGQKACHTHITEIAARDVIGMGLMEAIARLLPDANDQQLEQVATVYKQDYLHDNTIPSHLFDGVKELLTDLKQSGYLLAVATGKGRVGLELALTEHDMQQYFVTTRCAGEYPSKPHPEMLLSIINELGVPAQATLMIGDSEHDMRMANNAGVAAVGVTHGAHSAEVLNTHNPLMCLQHITDLSDFLSHNCITA